MSNQKAYKLADEWNKKYKVGQKVLIRNDEGDEIETITSGNATVMGGTAVCWGNKISGAYMLERFRAMDNCVHCKAVVVEPYPFVTDQGKVICDECLQKAVDNETAAEHVEHVEHVEEREPIAVASNLEELKHHVGLLKGLLDNPQVGTSEWCAAYGKCVTALTEFWKD